MNLIDESIQPKKKNNSKRTLTIIIALISILMVAMIAVVILIAYVKQSQWKLYIDGSQKDKVLEMMTVEDNGKTIYFPIKEIASYLGYESYNGEYSNKSEDQSKCYIICDDEVANFALNSNKIYTLTTTKSSVNINYDYFYAKKPVKSINGKLCATTDALEQAFNISFNYNEDKHRIQIYTMPYLIDSYEKLILDYGFEKIDEEFINHKAVLDDMLIVVQNGSYGVISTDGSTIIEPKYSYIEYLPNNGDFLVKSNGKVGILSARRETKIQISYDNLELIDRDIALYLAKRDNKYGIIDSKGNIKLYTEYDEIGIDISKFQQNDIKNKYLLDNGMIPVRKDELWGAFDNEGNMILDFEYDHFGYIASSNKDAVNLLIVPDYNVIVACKNNKYTLINSAGKELCYPVLDDVYMTIVSAKKDYIMNYNNQTAKVTDFLDQIGVKQNNNQTSKNNEEQYVEQEEQEEDKEQQNENYEEQREESEQNEKNEESEESEEQYEDEE